MEKSKTHIYLIPGMGANTKIFEYIKLPENDYVMHFIEWELPERKESLSDYAFRMTKKITHEKPILFGVSFGGILVQEMSKFVQSLYVLRKKSFCFKSFRIIMIGGAFSFVKFSLKYGIFIMILLL